MTRLLVTADDRTGALEVGGIIGTESVPVPVGPNASHNECCVIDIDSRQQAPAVAAQNISAVHAARADYRAHKMDSGLRGNWAHEAFALANNGYRVAIVPAYPDAGRTCVNGTVYIHGTPVLQSPFASDPLTRPVSSQPSEVLASLNCMHSNISIWDAADNAELQAAAQQCLDEQRIMLGPTGAIGAYASLVLGQADHAAVVTIPEGSLLIVSGSLNQTSRNQIRAIKRHTRNNPAIHVIESPYVIGNVDTTDATAMGEHLVKLAMQEQNQYDTLMVIGGDTCKALFGDDTLQVFGMIAPGIPISRWRNKTVITKGGGIGTEESLINIVAATSGS